MPWRDMWPMEQRLDFIREYDTGLFSMTELAAQYGISPKTAYKWLKRYEADGPLGLADRSRRPHHHPQATADDLVAMVIAERYRHPRWGAKKLLAVLRRREPRRAWPSRSTVCDLLKHRRLIAPRARRQRPPASARAALAPITGANDVWTTDFTRRVSDGRWPVLLPTDPPRRFQSVRVALRRAAGSHERPDAAALRARFCRIWLARAHSQR